MCKTACVHPNSSDEDKKLAKGKNEKVRKGGVRAEVNQANHHFDLKMHSLCAVMNNFVPKH